MSSKLSYIHEGIQGERGTIRRNWEIKNGKLLDYTDSEHGFTAYEMYKRATELFGDNKWLAVRDLNNDGTAGEYVYKTYSEVNDIVQLVKGSLVNCGVPAKSHVGLYGKNKPEWLVADFAAQSRACCTVPLYDTLGPEAAAYVIDHAECVAVFCDWDCLENAVAGSLAAGRVLFCVVFPLQLFQQTPENIKAHNDAVAANRDKGIDVYTWEEFLAKSSPAEDVPPVQTDLWTMCYTSGTTGTPKGVMLNHGNLVANAVSVMSVINSSAEDSVISYLPLAHMFERIVQMTMLMVGGSACFFRGDTLLLLEDVALAKPTVFVGVPRLYNKVYDKIMAQVEEGGFIKKTLFNWVLERKKSYLSQGYLTSMFDFVFGKVRDALGGRVRILVTGSAPISGVVMDFLRCAFSAPVIEGYGQTESTCAASTTPVELQTGGGHVGVPLTCNEITLFSVPDMNYTVNDVVDGKKVERGEICFRGPNVFQGYWKNPEKTAETIDSEGWLHSGDIGLWLPDGTLKIIDRKKNIFKLSQGEYVAPEKIENVYVQSKYVAQAFIYGNSLERHLVGIIVPDEEVLAVHCAANSIPGNFSDWCKNPSIKTMIIKDMQEKAKQNKLQGFENVRVIHLHDDLFTPENGILTPTFKLKRPIAQKLFQKVIDELYASIGTKLRSKL